MDITNVFFLQLMILSWLFQMNPMRIPISNIELFQVVTRSPSTTVSEVVLHFQLRTERSPWTLASIRAFKTTTGSKHILATAWTNVSASRPPTLSRWVWNLILFINLKIICNGKKRFFYCRDDFFVRSGLLQFQNCYKVIFTRISRFVPEN